MIKNIVFDLGNVLIDYNPIRLVKTIFSDIKEQELIYNEVFQSEGWRSLDQGLITFEEHYRNLAARFPKYADKINWLLSNWHLDQPPIPGMLELLEKLRSIGYNLFLLSNANSRYYTFQKYTNIFKLFTGITISSDLHLIKPQREIYDRFCQIHKLQPKQCLFIDDMMENVQGAITAGWQAYQFVGVDELFCFLEDTLSNQLR